MEVTDPTYIRTLLIGLPKTCLKCGDNLKDDRHHIKVEEDEAILSKNKPTNKRRASLINIPKIKQRRSEKEECLEIPESDQESD